MTRSPFLSGPNAAVRLRVLAGAFWYWRPGDRKARVVFWTLAAFALALSVIVYAAIIRELLGNVPSLGNTLSLYWDWSAFLHQAASPALIYRPHVLFGFQQKLVGQGATNLPFAYPPSMLLLLWPLALFSPSVAMLLWLLIGIGAYAVACHYPPRPRLTAALALIAPSTLAAAFYGQVSLLLAACLIGGCRLVERRPVMAGMLLGLAAVKPQFGLLVPVALISARQWRCVFSAAATVTATVLASGIAFGWMLWWHWPAAMVGLSGHVVHHARLDSVSPTITASIRQLGGNGWAAGAGQLAAAAIAFIATWLCFRRGFARPAVAVLLLGSIVATPYAWYTDLPLSTFAAFLLISESNRAGKALSVLEVAALACLVFAPAIVLYASIPAPFGLVVLLPLFGATAIRAVPATHFCDAFRDACAKDHAIPQLSPRVRWPGAGW